MFDHVAYLARLNGVAGWDVTTEGAFAFDNGPETAFLWFENLRRDPNPAYVDCHAWQFTPSSFRLALLELAVIGVVDLKEADFHDTVGFEFFVSLSRGATGCPLNRLSLALQMRHELAASPVETI